MKIISNYIITEGVDRSETATFFSQDKTLAYFFNLLQKRYFLFHNIEDIDYCRDIAVKIKNKLTDVEFLLFKTPLASHAFVSHLHNLKVAGVTDIFVCKDSVICTTKIIEHLNTVINFYKNTRDANFIFFGTKGGDLEKKGIIQKNTINISKGLKLYKFTSSDYLKFDSTFLFDQPFLANIDSLLSIFYDETYLSIENKEESENYIVDVLKKHPIKILLANKRLFINCPYFTKEQNVVIKRRNALKLIRELIKFKDV